MLLFLFEGYCCLLLSGAVRTASCLCIEACACLVVACNDCNGLLCVVRCWCSVVDCCVLLVV